MKRFILLGVLVLQSVSLFAVTDTFTDTDGTLITAHTSVTTWSFVEGFQTTDGVISNNAAASHAYRSMSYASTSSEDSSQIILQANLTMSGYGSPCVRMDVSSGARGYCISFSAISGSDWSGIDINKNGSYISGLGPVVVPTNQSHTLKITASGTNPVVITAYVDGSLIGTYNDSSSPLSTGKSGIFLFNNSGSDTVVLDDWTDGVSAPPSSPSRRGLLGVGR